MARLRDEYKNAIAPALMKKFGYKSVMQIPKLDKVVINVGCGEARDNAKMIDAIIGDVSAITGQRPVVCKAKKSVANFRLREGMPSGATKCMSLSTGSSARRFPASATSGASTPTPSTAAGTIPWASRSS